MKLNKFFLDALLFVTSINIKGMPLTIINSTVDTIIFNIELSNKTKRVPLKSIDKWSYELGIETFVSIKWSAYSDKLESSCNYTIDINEIMPKIAHGGSLVIFNEGGFIYDPKKGKIYPGSIKCSQ